MNNTTKTLREIIEGREFFKYDWKLSGGHSITALPYASELSETTGSIRVHFNIKSGAFAVIGMRQDLPLTTPAFF